MRHRFGHHVQQQAYGPWATWRRRVAYRLSILCSAVRALDDLLEHDSGSCDIRYRAARLRAKSIRDRAWPLVEDTDGRAWE